MLIADSLEEFAFGGIAIRVANPVFFDCLVSRIRLAFEKLACFLDTEIAMQLLFDLSKVKTQLHPRF